MSDLKDWRGTPIELGSTVIYPGRKGSRLYMTEGKVIRIEMINFYAIHTGIDPDWHLVIKPLRKTTSRGYVNPKELTITRTDLVTVVKEA